MCYRNVCVRACVRAENDLYIANSLFKFHVVKKTAKHFPEEKTENERLYEISLLRGGILSIGTQHVRILR